MSDDNPSGPDVNNFLSQIMDQARTVQGRMQDMQAKVKELTVEGTAGGGIVTVTATGAGRIKAIQIDPVAVDKRDVEMLEDLIVAGCNDALKKAQEMVESEMGSVTGGLNLGDIGSMFSKLGS